MIKEKCYKSYVKCKKCGLVYGRDEPESENSSGYGLCPMCCHAQRLLIIGKSKGPMQEMYERYKERIKKEGRLK